ncbi:CRISPR-associated endoribonuclease Cas6 [Thermovenabulum gondwanense]|uniref:CRISPR associated protein Cas6 C-terminal domain-containing protein n=1 Tax=Thermovenabulum gondwanense TaxID=520767 RepID=A0A161PW24_9FIRM|nr:CRISPR-associated endoribonuclease Cas6 [Thermovenabulum gondwanense]KYO67321.1 hypothetical protein ATZ99_06070 [Thermovenabulum gondwanense]
MRFTAIFSTDKLPQANNMLFVSLMKEAIQKSNPEYYEKIYFYDGKKNKRPKNFCFSIFVKDFEVMDEFYHIKDKIFLNISTPDYECGVNIYNGLLKIKNFNYKNFYLNREKIFLVREKKINDNQVVFKTLSPILIKDKNNNFLEPKNEKFNEEMNYICNEILRNYRGIGLKRPLTFQDISLRKKVVKQEIEGFTQITGKKIFYANAYAGLFKLEGDVSDLDDLYKLGIGFRRSQGFGMIEVV